MSNLKQKRFVDTDYLQESVIERLEILENVTEGQNMEYSTDQGFIHCNNTKKGRVNDLTIEGNTMVNYCRDGSKTLTLNGDINEVGTHITTTNAVNNGLVDVMCEGETLVNVCNQKDPIAITKSYTVENTNHVPLQGEYDGKARPVVEGNTLVNIHPKSTPALSTSDKDNPNYNVITKEGYIKVTGSDLGTTNYRYVNMGRLNFEMFKPNTTYTLVFTKLKGVHKIALQNGDSKYSLIKSMVDTQDDKLLYTVVTKEALVKSEQILYLWLNPSLTTIDLEVENPMIFEGDLTANPPSGYIEGLKSSFEDQLVPVDIFDTIEKGVISTENVYSEFEGRTLHLKKQESYQGSSVTPSSFCSFNNNVEVGKTYTLKFTCDENNAIFSMVHNNNPGWTSISHYVGKDVDNNYTIVFTPTVSSTVWLRVTHGSSPIPSLTLTDMYLVEGDYRNHFSLYDVTNHSGKYKVEYKVTGKNKFDGNFTNGYITKLNGKDIFRDDVANTNIAIVKLIEGRQYSISKTGGNRFIVATCSKIPSHDEEVNVIINDISLTSYTLTVPMNEPYILVYVQNETNTDSVTLQIEEGSSKTTYEEYKEYTKTFYLNSPLLEGDTIEDVNGKATHVKRYKQVVLDGSSDEPIGLQKDFNNQTNTIGFNFSYFSDGNNVAGLENSYCNKFSCYAQDFLHNNDIEGISQGYRLLYIRILRTKLTTQDVSGLRQWLQSNPITVTYKLYSPIYEKISEESILTDSYVNGHLDLDTNVTVNKVEFRNPSGLYLKYLTTGQKYAVQFTSDNVGITTIFLSGSITLHNQPIVKGVNKFYITKTSDTSTNYLTFNGIGFNASNISVVATEREFDYFEGLSSVGQDNENGHNLEITSRNKNLVTSVMTSDHPYDEQGWEVTSLSNGTYVVQGTRELDTNVHKFGLKIIARNLKPNTTYTFNYNVDNNLGKVCYTYPLASGLWSNDMIKSAKVPYSFTTPNGVTDICIGIAYGKPSSDVTLNISNIQLEEGDTVTPHTSHRSNTKSIPLNEPLRSLPNGVKDRFVKMNNKWYIERRCGEVLLTPELIWQQFANSTDENYTIFYANTDVEVNSFVISDRIPASETGWVTSTTNKFRIGSHSSVNSIRICIEKEKLKEANVNGFKEWIKNNPTIAIYQLTTPVYEELTVDPTLTTYVDQTHISTNSVIPCDMKVKNSGYNVLLKPSTLYTVALDTSNREGTNVISDIKVNLGGAEKTATNNIVTLTTPSTLVDDSLRISGKGLTSTNVRLLEVDKTNFIPSYFEGLKSSFEEKQGDNHIVEVVSNNKNLLDLNNAKIYNANFSYDRLICREDNNGLIVDKKIENNKLSFTIRRHCTYGVAFLIKTIPNKKYTLKAKGKCVGGTMQSQVDYFTLAYRTSINNESDWTREMLPTDFLREYDNIKNVPIETEGEVTFTAKHNYAVVGICSTYMDWVNTDTPDNDMAMYEFEDICVTQSDIGSDYIPHETNKIQFSTLEPLRSVGNVKDKIVYKDNKWMIERNCMQIDLTSSLTWSLNATTVSKNSTQFVSRILNGYVYDSTPREEQILCNKKPTKNSNDGNNSIWVYDKSTIVMQMDYRFIKTLSDFKKWLDTEKPYIVVPLTNPTYEEIGEYRNLDSYDEGTTIYANTLIAPKPLSFNLATHMSNIVKDVQDDVSDLKTWRSEVFDSITHKKTFDNGFTTIEDTKEGVIDEVKLEGKTLVNLFKIDTLLLESNDKIRARLDTSYKELQYGKKVTVFNYHSNDVVYDIYDVATDSWVRAESIKAKDVKSKVIELGDTEYIYMIYTSNATGTQQELDNIRKSTLLLEGDHTQNPPSYFEGLKSVGDTTDEIVVSSVKGDGNLFDSDFWESGFIGDSTGNYSDDIDYVRTKKIRVLPNTLYTFKGYTRRIYYYDINGNFISKFDIGGGTFLEQTNSFTTPSNCVYIALRYDLKNSSSIITSLDMMKQYDTIICKNALKDGLIYQSDKKRLLYYNNETQTWEKPILRQWDSIEKHANGKYYYHQRSGEVVLNGSEKWIKEFNFTTPIYSLNQSGYGVKNGGVAICDKYTNKIYSQTESNYECIYLVNISNEDAIRIQDPSSDVDAFKSKLQANNVTVVYQLAQEKVYEVFNLELNSYDGETNVIVNSGAISPITTVSLTSNLPQVAENLKNRVRQLEAEIYNYKVTQNLRQLRTFYKSDYANFGVATVGNTFVAPTSLEITPYGYDLFELFKEIISEGKDCYDRIELEEYIDFYVMTFIFDFEMAFELFDMIDSQHLDTEIEDEPIEDEEDSEIIEDEPIDPDFSVDYEEPTIEEDIDVEMGVIPEDDLIDIEMGVIPNDDLIDIEMGVIPNEDIDVEFSVDVEEEDQTKDEDLEV